MGGFFGSCESQLHAVGQAAELQRACGWQKG
jgi:hypothetical protein